MLSPITHYTFSNLLKGMGTVEVLPRTLKLKKTAKPTKAKPTTSPTSSPTVLTALKIIDQTVSTLLPDGETDYDDPITKW